MTRRHVTLYGALTIPLVSLFFLTGCPENPYDPDTWIEKLDQPGEVKNAITQLQRLKVEDGIEKAIEPLAEAWDAQNRPKKILTVIIEIAEEGKGGPYWDLAIPVLETALKEFDVGDNKSIENAITAAEALGRAKKKETVPTLVATVRKVMPKLSPGQRVRLTAIASLGHFGKDPSAVGALVKVMSADPKDQPPQLFAAAALAMAEARSPAAVEPLLVAMYKIGAIYPQVRRALIAIGVPARDRLISVFQKKDEVMNQLAKDNKFNVDCEKMAGDADESKCQAPSNLEYKAALLLGDFYSSEAVKPLMKGLDDKAWPAFFANGMPGPTQHTAILDALKKIGDETAAERVWDYANNQDTDDAVRPLAVDTYSYLTRSTKKLATMAKTIKDDDADDQVRMASGIAYGRLANTEKHYEPLLYMIKRYKDKAKEKEDESKKAEKKAEKLKKEFKALDEKTKDKKNKKLVKARSKMESAQQDKSIADSWANQYRGFQRSFEQNLARAHIGTTCKKDPKCYVETLDKSEEDIGKSLSKYIKNWKDWSKQEKTDLKIAAVERSLVELRKMGKDARPVVDTLLKHVESKDRITRQGSLMALVKIAELPCDKCADRLQEVITKQKNESTLAALTVETQAVQYFFLWAGK